MDSRPLDQGSPWIRRLFPPLTALTFTGSMDRCPVSIVILARDEERCIARCLDSVTGRGFDNVLVVDTGSIDNTVGVVVGYGDRGVRLLETSWPGSFAEVRNLAIETVAAGWIVFLDADEWLTERSSAGLRPCLDSLADADGLRSLTFAPRIRDVVRDTSTDDIPRIFMADSRIRFRGLVHEYPVIQGPTDTPVRLVGLDIDFEHDGYLPAVAEVKDKRNRNLTLLDAARAADPGNPRWLFFTVRDAGLDRTSTQIVELCTSLRDLAGGTYGTGDRQSARNYYYLAFGFACRALVALGEWRAVHRLCDDLDSVERRVHPDAHYFRMLFELSHGVVTSQDLLRTIRIRGEDELVSTSPVDQSGKHLDALVVALLTEVRGSAEADRYHELCEPWTDMFFDRSRWRGHRSVVSDR